MATTMRTPPAGAAPADDCDGMPVDAATAELQRSTVPAPEGPR